MEKEKFVKDFPDVIHEQFEISQLSFLECWRELLERKFDSVAVINACIISLAEIFAATMVSQNIAQENINARINSLQSILMKNILTSIKEFRKAAESNENG
jgi:hypothetical protein